MRGRGERDDAYVCVREGGGAQEKGEEEGGEQGVGEVVGAELDLVNPSGHFWFERRVRIEGGWGGSAPHTPPV